MSSSMYRLRPFRSIEVTVRHFGPRSLAFGRPNFSLLLITTTQAWAAEGILFGPGRIQSQSLNVCTLLPFILNYLPSSIGPLPFHPPCQKIHWLVGKSRRPDQRCCDVRTRTQPSASLRWNDRCTSHYRRKRERECWNNELTTTPPLDRLPSTW